MKELLRRLLEDLETIEEEHEEVGDTAVREALRAALHEGFINPKPGFVLGDDFEMYTAKGNMPFRCKRPTGGPGRCSTANTLKRGSCNKCPARPRKPRRVEAGESAQVPKLVWAP